MKLWIATVVGAIALIGWSPWLIAWTVRRFAAPDDLPIQKPRYVFLNADEGLRQRTAKKRQAADTIRNRAAKVESGAPVSDVLRVIRR